MAESADPFAELDRKYPGFKKKPGYIKLEQQSKTLGAKTSLLSRTFTANLSSLRDKMSETREQMESHKDVKQQAANMLSKRVTGATS